MESTGNLTCGKEEKNVFIVREERIPGLQKSFLDLREKERHWGESKNSARPRAVVLKVGVPGTAASASPGNPGKCKACSYLTATGGEALEMGSRNLCFNSSPCDSDAGLSLRTPGLVELERNGGGP